MRTISALLPHTIPELAAMVKSLEVVAAYASLTINGRKAKTLSLTRNANGLVQVGGGQIETVDKFTYLRSEIDASDGTDLDIESRIKKVFRFESNLLSKGIQNTIL